MQRTYDVLSDTIENFSSEILISSGDMVLKRNYDNTYLFAYRGVISGRLFAHVLYDPKDIEHWAENMTKY